MESTGSWLCVSLVVLALKARAYDSCGIDYTHKIFEKLNYYFPDVPYKFGDVRDLSFAANSFDAYIFSTCYCAFLSRTRSNS